MRYCIMLGSQWWSQEKERWGSRRAATVYAGRYALLDAESMLAYLGCGRVIHVGEN